jgi:hypothetical protein
VQTVRIFEEGKLIFNSEVCLENGIIGRSDTLMQEKIKSFMNAPWWSFTKSMSEYLNEELKKELSQKHLLYGKETNRKTRR